MCPEMTSTGLLMTYKFRRPPYVIGSALPLAESHINQIIDSFGSPEKSSPSNLSGRTGIKKIDLQGAGKVVIKQYFRGGILRHINRRTYLYTGKPRSQTEFEMLSQVRQIGVPAPEPVAFAIKGKLLYHAWLLTKELPDVQALSEFSLHAPESARAVIPAVGRQIQMLVRQGIYHVDLHPGNVLVDKNHKVYFIDFDKARVSSCRKRKLRHRYAERWTRAARKYGLPEFVIEALQAELFKNSRIPTK